MQKLILVSIIFLLCMFSAHAFTSDTAYITLTILNRAPLIESLSIEPANAYPDSELRCVAELNDEQPCLVSYETAWYVNGNFVKRAETITNLNANDHVECRVVANDNKDQTSNEARATTIVQQAPLNTQLLTTALTASGATIDTNQAHDLQQQDLTAITGYAVSNARVDSTGMVGLLLVIVIFLFLLNIRLVLARKKTAT